MFSPRAAVLLSPSDKCRAWGNFGSGFRAPTLNELYRQFRVGALLTLANEALGPERLIGGELGINVAPVEQPRVCGVSSSTTASRIRCRTSRARIGEHPAAPEPRSDAHLGAADRRGIPDQSRMARERRLPVQPGEGDGVRGQSGAGRHLPAAGARASRLGRRVLLESTFRDSGAERDVLWASVRRRPELCGRSPGTPNPACRRTAWWN